MSFVSERVGYAAAEAGLILKTVDGGETWQPVLSLGYPWYFRGVHALSASDVVVAGFCASATCDEAIIKWTHDGGASWSADLVVDSSNHIQGNRVHFWDSSVGFATTFAGSPDLFRTTSGGQQLADWDATTINNGDWFGAQFSALPNGHVRISGIDFCESTDYAATWNCRPSIDSVFDGATFFFNDKVGWVGGGVISLPTEGWVHRTTDGGKTWSDRTLDITWPIREIIFVNAKDGWAAGGAGNMGGVHVSHDGGDTWQLELDAGVELTACSTADYHIVCAGYDDLSNSRVFARDYDHIRRDAFDGDASP